MLTHALLLALAEHACGWTTISQSSFGVSLEAIKRQFDPAPAAEPWPSPNELLGFLWTMPDDPVSTRGLGGGIAWAWDPALCDKIVHRFEEDLAFMPYVGCHELKAAMHRGFASWADNHAMISFVDVTAECAAIGRPDAGCPLAEVWVTAMESAATQPTQQRLTADDAVIAEGNDGPGLGNGGPSGDGAVAVATPVPSASATFRYTSGERPLGRARGQPRVIETRRATIAFNTQRCWYLDSTFCYYFHSLKGLADPSTVLTVGRSTLLSLWGMACVVILVQLALVLRKQCVAGGTVRERCRESLRMLSHWSVTGTAVRMVLIVTPPLFYVKIFLPCWECYDFEAAATHEVGHVLGLSHPVAGNSTNVYVHPLAGRLTNSSCRDPWAAVVQGVPPAELADVEADGLRPSVMKAFTQHNPTVCLQQDDVEALSVLYPDCELSVSSPVCYKTEHNIGWVRLGTYIVGPALLALLLVLVLNGALRKHTLARLKSAGDLVEETEMRLDSARGHHAREQLRAEELEVRLERQMVSEEQRVQHEAQRRLSLHLAEASIAEASLARSNPHSARPLGLLRQMSSSAAAALASLARSASGVSGAPRGDEGAALRQSDASLVDTPDEPPARAVELPADVAAAAAAAVVESSEVGVSVEPEVGSPPPPPYADYEGSESFATSMALRT